MVARTLSVALSGMIGKLVEVEADISSQLPRIVLIGLPDSSAAEAPDRIAAAAINSGAPLPARRITINLTPAELPKHGARFDLAIALAALAASGVIPADSLPSLAKTVHIGELGLDGRLRPISGVLPAVAAAVAAGYERIMLPTGNLAEAKLVPNANPIAVNSLNHALLHYGAKITELAQEAIQLPVEGLDLVESGDLSEVIGNPDAVQATLTAAAGGHNLLLIGPPGSGKSMLAERFAGILPLLNHAEALEVSSIYSIAGYHLAGGLIRRPRVHAPHHTATKTAIVGGGSSTLRPGAASLAHRGVLFLDEAAEFPRSVLDSLRQPIESGKITLHRVKHTVEYPAKFQLMLATNPCPCGKFSALNNLCTCPVAIRRRYLARLSGPLLDRVDIRVHTHAITSAQLRKHSAQTPQLTSAEAREQVLAARQSAANRLTGTAWQTNAEVSGSYLRKELKLPVTSTNLLDNALETGRLSMRGYDRVLRVAWTIADLSGLSAPGNTEIGKALYLRQVIS